MSFFDEIGTATRAGYNRMIKSRQAAANRQIRNYLGSLDERTLRQLGYSSDDLKRF